VISGGLMSTRGGNLELTFPDLPPIPDIDFPDFGTIELDTRMIYVDVPAFLGVGVAKFGENRIEAIGGAMIGLRVHARRSSRASAYQRSRSSPTSCLPWTSACRSAAATRAATSSPRRTTRGGSRI
jgi:hypothetical protein